MRGDAGGLTVLDECGGYRPRVATLVGAQATGVLAVESERADGALDGGAIDIDAGSVDEAEEAVPPRKRVADRFAKTSLISKLLATCFKESVEFVEGHAAVLVARFTALVGR